MGASQDLLGIGVNLQDDGSVVVVVTFEKEQIALSAPDAILVGAAIINAASHAGCIEVEISELPAEEREAGIRKIRDRYSAGTN